MHHMPHNKIIIRILVNGKTAGVFWYVRWSTCAKGIRHTFTILSESYMPVGNFAVGYSYACVQCVRDAC